MATYRRQRANTRIESIYTFSACVERVLLSAGDIMGTSRGHGFNSYPSQDAFDVSLLF